MSDDAEPQDELEPTQGEASDQEQPAESEGLDEDNAALSAKINEAVENALLEQQDTLLRAKAEVQNMRRRCEADVEKAHKFALEKFSHGLLDVMDNMERALQSVDSPEDENIKGFYDGVVLTKKGLLEVFNKNHIEQINPEGEPFDPQCHQAMQMLENKDVEPNTVIGVMQKGYRLNNRVIRPAMVLVSKG